MGMIITTLSYHNSIYVHIVFFSSWSSQTPAYFYQRTAKSTCQLFQSTSGIQLPPTALKTIPCPLSPPCLMSTMTLQNKTSFIVSTQLSFSPWILRTTLGLVNQPSDLISSIPPWIYSSKSSSGLLSIIYINNSLSYAHVRLFCTD